METIYLITDYYNRFGTKFTARPYRSGMDHMLLREAFRREGIEPLFVNASALASGSDDPAGRIFLYTSTEDQGGYYKAFIEDLVLSLAARGATIIPKYEFLRAHNNKVFMEMLKREWGPAAGDLLASRLYGSYDELLLNGIDIGFPLVVKKPDGFKSRNVWLVNDMNELTRVARKISSSFSLKRYVADRLRLFKHPGLRPESHRRHGFMVQQFVPGLVSDYKVLIYGDKYFPLLRRNRPGDFRASGSGLLSYPESLPDGLLGFCRKLHDIFDAPSVSLDIAYDGSNYHVLETQFVYFGTYTVEHAAFWFTAERDQWKRVDGRAELESLYAGSIAWYLRKKSLLE